MIDRSDFCDGEHEYEPSGIIQWDTQFEDLNERFYTEVLECQECSCKKWVCRERQSVIEWSQ